MKNLLLITLVLYTGLAGAQGLSKKRVDRKTGDTVQSTRERTLYNAVGNYVLATNDFIGWRIKKVSAKQHRADTLFLILRINPRVAHDKYFQVTRDSSLLRITFAGGRSSDLKASSVVEWQYSGLAESSPTHGNPDIFASYPLSAGDIRALAAEPLTAVLIHTVAGPANYPVRRNHALKIQEVMSKLGKAE
jgi:hypothetical protein